MNSETIIQILIYAQVFVLGALAVLVVRYARAHFGGDKHEHHAEPVGVPPLQAELPPAVKERLVQASETEFQSAVQSSSSKLQHDLEASSEQIKNLINRIATDIVADEMQRYRAELTHLRQQAQTEMGGISADVAKYQDQIKAKIAQELEAEKQKLVQQIDTKLADAVGSFLVETLQHNVDLGSQSAYLVQMLEEHKADFIKEVGQDESKARG